MDVILVKSQQDYQFIHYTQWINACFYIEDLYKNDKPNKWGKENNSIYNQQMCCVVLLV